MKLELNTSICPIICVGMYESRISPEYIFEQEEREVEESAVLTDEEKEYCCGQFSLSFERDKYKEAVAQCAANAIEKYFKASSETVK